jgi:hypothetical protein
MKLEMWFWAFYVFSLLFCLWSEYTPAAPYPWRLGFKWIVFYVLVGILGYQAFGSAIK